MKIDVNTAIQLINGVGFPIFACMAMGAFVVWDKKTRKDTEAKQQDKHEKVLENITTALNQNTLVIQKLVDKLGGVDDAKTDITGK